MFTCKVGCCLSTLFVFDQQTIHRKTLRRISGVLKLQRIILESKCAISEREIILKIENNKRRAERANQKHVNNLTFGATVCFNGCQKTSNVWWQIHHVWHSIRTRFFVSCPRLDATDGIN